MHLYTYRYTHTYIHVLLVLFLWRILPDITTFLRLSSSFFTFINEKCLKGNLKGRNTDIILSSSS